MKKLILILIVILYAICGTRKIGYGFDEWTTEDTKYQLICTTLTVVDWKQTRQIARNPDIWEETNPFLGRHPSESEVNTYMAFTILGHILVSCILPKEYRRNWQMFWIGVEANLVRTNYHAGIRITF